MDRHQEATLLLKETKAIAESPPGKHLPLTKPALSEWSSKDDRWLVIVGLWFLAGDYNKGISKVVAADIEHLRKRVQKEYGIRDE